MHLQGGPKIGKFLYVKKTSSNIDQCSNFFHCRNRENNM